MLGLFSTASRRTPHCHSPGVATVARRLRIDVHNNDNAWQRGPLWPHRMGPIKKGAIGYGSFFSRDVIYTSRTYATMSVSVCLSICLWPLCIVVTGCNGSRIPLHAWIDGCLCYLLTTPYLDRRMGWCRDFWWKREGVISRYPSHCNRPSCSILWY